MNSDDCCSGAAAACEVPKPGSCARCGGELAAWTMARGTVVYCGWYCWHSASHDEPPVEEPRA